MYQPEKREDPIAAMEDITGMTTVSSATKKLDATPQINTMLVSTNKFLYCNLNNKKKIFKVSQCKVSNFF